MNPIIIRLAANHCNRHFKVSSHIHSTTHVVHTPIMFITIPVLSVVLVAVSSASGLILPHHRSLNMEVRATQPKSWATGYLEVSLIPCVPFFDVSFNVVSI